MTQGTQHSAEDPRNADILISINGVMKHRSEAMVSVFDSGFVLGDGVWEGFRVVGGHPLFLDAHLDRLHVRLMVTRGVKSTPYQDPRVTVGPATVVIIPEYKTASPATAARGLSLYTVHVRRGYPDVQDPKLNSHSKLNCITACIQAYGAGADEALMLDPHGFVATCNSTHFFIVRKGEVWTSTGQYCLGGITRANVITICRDNGIPVFEKSFSLTDVYGADEAFVTGTFAGVVPVHTVDSRRIGDDVRSEDDARGPMVQRLQALYQAFAAADVAGRGRPA